jgi:hypothetical protein
MDKLPVTGPERIENMDGTPKTKNGYYVEAPGVVFVLVPVDTNTMPAVYPPKPAPLFTVRPFVAALALLIEGQLAMNDDKGGWEEDPLHGLMNHAHDEAVEFTTALANLQEEALSEGLDLIAMIGMCLHRLDNWGVLAQLLPAWAVERQAMRDGTLSIGSVLREDGSPGEAVYYTDTPGVDTTRPVMPTPLPPMQTPAPLTWDSVQGRLVQPKPLPGKPTGVVDNADGLHLFPPDESAAEDGGGAQAPCL